MKSQGLEIGPCAMKSQGLKIGPCVMYHLCHEESVSGDWSLCNLPWRVRVWRLILVWCITCVCSPALLVYRVFRSERKLRLKIAHAVLQALALIISAVGLKAVFDSHNLAADPHANLYTLHSWIGLATIVLFGVQVSTRSSLVFWCASTYCVV